MASKTNNVVISYFAGQDLAATAGDEIRDWDKANDDIKLGGIGILTWKDGEIKTNKLVRASSGAGAKWGMALGVTAGILSGGATLVAGAVAGATVGAVSAKLFHKNIGLTDEDKARLEQRLSTGSAALVVMAADDEVEPTKTELAALGGEVEAYRVPEETMVQVEAAQEVQADAGEPAPIAEPAPAAEAAPVAAAAATVAGEQAGTAPDAEAAAPRIVVLVGTLESVEGIGPTYVAQLKAAGLGTKRRLLVAGATPDGRARIAEQTKISQKLIGSWVSAIDLSRVTGIQAQNGELLVAGGVLTVGQLAEQEPGELRVRLAALNAEKKLVREVPGVSQLTKWIAQAKDLPQLVTLAEPVSV